MLYEVITVDAPDDALDEHLVLVKRDQRAQRRRRQRIHQYRVARPAARVHAVARITSYNVCYTKLLRYHCNTFCDKKYCVPDLLQILLGST